MSSPTRALLTDGRQALLRPAEASDEEALIALHQRLSERSLYLRFFTENPSAGADFVRRVVHMPGAFGHSIVAELDGRLVGMATYQTLDRPTVAEVALIVADDIQSCGIGTLLLEHLVSHARRHGVETFHADVLAENSLMLRVFADAGLEEHLRRDGTTLIIDVSLRYDDRYLDAMSSRESRADAVSLGPLLAPTSVAVIGASRREGSVGHAVLRRLLDQFRGPVYPVNPHAEVVAGRQAFGSVADLPLVPDLAVIAVPAARVADAAEECGRAGVRALVVISAGLSIAGPDSSGQRLLDAVHRYGMRMVGPNCIGVANTADTIGLDATFTSRQVPPGSVGVVTQSGGIGIALVESLAAAGLGISTFVSTGDKYDLSSNDLLMWWSRDDRTKVAVVYVESFGNPRKFARLARQLAARLPVVAVRAAGTPAAQRAAQSHTAATATPAVTRDALFLQAGVIATDDLQETVDVVTVLSCQPLPAGNRVAVMSNAGGAGVLAADACARHGLELPTLSQGSRESLRDILPAAASIANPLDTTADVSDSAFAAAAGIVAADPEVDALVVVVAPTALGDLTTAMDAAATSLSTPVVGVVLGQTEAVCTRGSVPVFSDPAAALRAVGHAARHSVWLRRQTGALPAIDGIDKAVAVDAIADYLSSHPDGGWLDWSTTRTLATSYGLPVAPSMVAHGPDEAAKALSTWGGSVAMKGLVTDLVHRTGAHAIALDVSDESTVIATYQAMADRFGDSLEGVLVQPMVVAGTELLIGVVQDDTFGPLVQVGAGGITTDVVADRAARLLPLTDRDVQDMLQSLRIWPLLKGFRGSPPLDVTAVEDLVARVARLADDLPQVAELDLNPVLVHPAGVVAVDIKVRVAPADPVDPYLRRLR